MTTVEIGPARRSELARIIALCDETFAQHAEALPDVFASARLRTAHHRRFRRSFRRALVLPRHESHTIFCARAGDELLGYVALAHTLLGTSIFDIHVMRDRRQQGVGKRLVQHALKICATRRTGKVTASVWLGNDASFALFDRMGFARKLTIFETLPPDGNADH